MQVRQLRSGSRVQAPLVVRDAQVRRRRDGSELIRLTLGDRTGAVPAVVLECVEQARAACIPGQIAHVSGTLDSDPRYGTRLVVESIHAAAEGEYDPHELLDGPAHPAAVLEQDLRELLATIQRPELRALLDSILGEDAKDWPAFRDCPAAKRYHQAYRHGLLEHSLTVAQAVSAISATFGGIDRDVAVAGALLHDIGKLETYRLVGETIEMTDCGRLYGEIPLGYYRIRRAIEQFDDFPADVAQALLHIILSHHGSLEHGSPVVPATREAALVHGIDSLGARLGSFDRVEKTLVDGQQWSGYDKGLGGGAYFAETLGRAA